MAVTSSGLYVQTFLGQFNASQYGINLVGDTVKCALYDNTITPNFSTDTSYSSSPYTAGQISGSGYTAGGATMASKTFTESPSGTLMFDAADTSWTSSTFTGARAALIYDDTVVNKRVIGLVNLGSDYAVSSGTFTIQWSATGIFAIDITP